jgi:hypothetical protein
LKNFPIFFQKSILYEGGIFDIWGQGTVKLYFNHTAPLDPLPVCSLILPPMHSKYSGQLVVNSQYRLTVNTPFSQDAVTGILRIKQLVAVYTDPVLHR